MKNQIVKCKVCGADMANSAKVCPNCGAKNKRKHPILGGILVFFGIVAIVSAINGGGSTPKRVNDSTAVSSSASGTKSKAPNQEKTTFNVGEKVELNNIIVTLVNVSTNTGGNYMKPSDEKEFIVCEFEIENNSTSDIAVSSLMSFEAYVDEYSTGMNLSATMSTDKPQLDGAVAAGKKMNGVIGYEASPEWKSIEIKFTPNFWSGKDITFVANK